MNDEITKVRSLLEAAQRKLKDLDKQALVLRSEIAAYEKVCLILAGEDIPHANGKTGPHEGTLSRKARGLSDTWQKVIYWISSQTTPPETEHIYAYTQKAGLNVNRNTLRSQLSVYTSSEILKRIDGHYIVTERGLELLQIPQADEPSASEPQNLPPLFDDVTPETAHPNDEPDDDLPF